jgi:DNA-binding NtrC family response regulator
MLKILIIEEDVQWKKSLSKALGPSYTISFWSDEEDIFKKLNTEHCSLIILDLQIKKMDPFDLLDWIRAAMPHIPVIVTSRTKKTELVVRAVKNGAFDFIAKPYIAEK